MACAFSCGQWVLVNMTGFSYFQVEGYTFEGNSDIAGVGVFLAFILTGWASFIVSLIGYTYLPNQAPGSRKQLDDIVLDIGQRVAYTLRRCLSRSSHLAHASDHDPIAKPRKVRELVLAVAAMLGDTQLVTGTAILASVVIQICSLSVYHLHISTLYALVALSTLQSTSSICSESYQLSGPIRIWRLCWMALFGGICLFANLVFAFSGPEPTPYRCYVSGSAKDTKRGDLNILWATVVCLGVFWSVVRIFYFIVPRIRPLFYPVIYGFRLPTYQYLLLRKIPATLIGLLPNNRGLRSIAWLPFLVPLFPFWLWAFLTLTVYTLACSRAADIFRAYGFLLLCTIQVPASKREASQFYGLGNSEDEWGFGQILPLMLLGLPLTSLIGALRHPRIDCRYECASTVTLHDTLLDTTGPLVMPMSSEETLMEADSKTASEVKPESLSLDQEAQAWENELLAKRAFRTWLMCVLVTVVGGLTYTAYLGYAI